MFTSEIMVKLQKAVSAVAQPSFLRMQASSVKWAAQRLYRGAL